MSAEIEVLQPGLFSTIQDLGRFGYMKYGVPLSGAMDAYAAKLANLLLGNREDCAVMEITQSGPKLKFTGSTQIIICGADFTPNINGRNFSVDKPLLVQAGDVLSFGKPQSGSRAYIGIKNGFKTEKVLGSRSWYEGITGNFRLEKGMVLNFLEYTGSGEKVYAAVKTSRGYLSSTGVEVFTGPEFHLLPLSDQKRLLDSYYTVGKNHNRMAFQLEEAFDNELAPILTGPVVPGTVQLTPGGNLIILMRDCQTTGGYPRVLQLSERGINAVAQKNMGDGFRFIRKEVKQQE